MILDKNKKLLLGFAFVLLCVSVLWVWLVAPVLTKIPSDFSYKANIISLDNFYDEEKKEFFGEKRSVTSFYYEVTDKNKDILTIKNVFDVRKVTGEKIFAVERSHDVDAITGKHVSHVGNMGDIDYGGYTFAPKHIKNGEQFTYWHYSHNKPAHMIFSGEENILGLPVYRYETRYEGTKIDDTANLSFLPGVGITRGVILEPYLQIWVEPITGRLIKFHEDSTYYFYDLKTGEKQNPKNHFSNKYTKKSIEEHVSFAKSEKLKHILIETVVPLLLVLIALSLFVGISRKKIAWILFILGIVALGGYVTSRVYTPGEPVMVKIGIARWVNNPLHEKNIEAFKQVLVSAGYKEGENIRYFEPEASNADSVLHRRTIDGFVKENVDLIYSVTTGGTLVVKSVTSTIPVVFSAVTHPVETGIIKSLQNSGNNLVGSRNWISAEEQVAFMRELVPSLKSIGFVHRKGESNSVAQSEEFLRILAPLGIKIIEIDPGSLAEIRPAMEKVRGQIDALYSACDSLIQGQQGDDIVIAYAKEERIPDFACAESGVRKGSLMGITADFSENGRLSGGKVLLILEGLTPQSLETTSVARPFIYINKTTADRLGITLSQSLITATYKIID